jgi:hypothetical protein
MQSIGERRWFNNQKHILFEIYFILKRLFLTDILQYIFHCILQHFSLRTYLFCYLFSIRYIGCSVKFPVKVGVEESIVNASTV